MTENQAASGRYQNIPINPPSNSHKSRGDAVKKNHPEKNVQQVTRSVAKTRKKPLGRQVVESFGGEDLGSVSRYLFFEVFIPSAVDLVIDMSTQGIQRLLKGENARRPVSRSSRSSRPGYMSYVRARDERPGGRDRGRPMSTRARENHDFDEIVLDTRGEAEEVLDELGDLVHQYDVATVTDLYKLVGIVGSFTDDRWGWNDLRSARVRMVMGGAYVLDLPKPIYLD